MRELVLYSTDHCSLCEQALEVLFGMPDLVGFKLNVIDISSSDELTSRYGTQIPVLRIGQSYLTAPFDRTDIQRWLEALEAEPE